MSREAAAARLNERVECGRELRRREIKAADALVTLEADAKKWTSFNRDLLKVMFTTNAFANEYVGSFGTSFVSWGRPPSLTERLSDVHRDLDKQINRLESFVERLELYSTSSSGFAESADDGTTLAFPEANILRELLPKLKSDDARSFVNEAIVAAEHSLFRAAVVLSWVGAVALLHEEVVAYHLALFNSEAQTRDSKWRQASNADDLGRMREAMFLEILQATGVISKHLKQELEVCLKLRNACGHPTSLQVGSRRVAAHIETLALNVYAVYGIA